MTAGMTQDVPFPEAVPRLTGESVHLRELSERDIPAWFARATDAESADLAGDPIPASIDAGAAWLQRHRDRFRARTAIRWAIVPNAGEDSVGTVGLSITSQEHGIAELGIVLARAHWRRGLGSAAARLVVAYAFDTMALREIHAEVLQRNTASVRLLEKVGLRRVGDTAAATAAEPDRDACFFYVLVNPKQERRATE